MSGVRKYKNPLDKFRQQCVWRGQNGSLIGRNRLIVKKKSMKYRTTLNYLNFSME